MIWLHISDLHYEPDNINFDKDECLSELKKMLEQQNKALKKFNKKISEVFFTGDLRFAKKESGTKGIAIQAVRELGEIARCAGVTSNKHIHLVPGNHDLNRVENEETPVLDAIHEKYHESPGSFTGQVEGRTCEEYLKDRFDFFVHAANGLQNSVWANMNKKEKPLHFFRNYGCFSIIYMNTAIACGRKKERGKLVIGYNDLHRLDKEISEMQNEKKNTHVIAIGHHGLECLDDIDKRKVERMFKNYGVKIYLCGDAHLGDDSRQKSFTQIVSGCLTVEQGVEQTFYIGELHENGDIEVGAFTYNSRLLRWGFNGSLSDDIEEHLPIVRHQNSNRDSLKSAPYLSRILADGRGSIVNESLGAIQDKNQQQSKLNTVETFRYLAEKKLLYFPCREDSDCILDMIEEDKSSTSKKRGYSTNVAINYTELLNDDNRDCYERVVQCVKNMLAENESLQSYSSRHIYNGDEVGFIKRICDEHNIEGPGIHDKVYFVGTLSSDLFTDLNDDLDERERKVLILFGPDNALLSSVLKRPFDVIFTPSMLKKLKKGERKDILHG